MTSTALIAIGLISVALGGVSGFALLAAVDAPDTLRKFGVVDPRRIHQLHLDWIIMGCVVGFVGIAVPGLHAGFVLATAFGGIVNPLTFLPMVFSRTIASTRAFQIVSFVSFTSLCIGLFGAVVTFLATL